MAKTGDRLPILLLDFDGVIHNYYSGWHGPLVIMDGVTDGFFQWLEEAVRHFTVVVHSSRSKEPGAIAMMRDWLDQQWLDHVGERFYQMPPIEFVSDKPAAFLSIDDRALTFTGDWNDFHPARLREFRPWNKR